MLNIKALKYVWIGSMAVLLLGLAGCKKNDYFQNTGTHNADYDGTVLQYLQNHPYHQFDSLCRIIKLANMEDVFRNEKITFFAPADTTIRRSIKALNVSLFTQGRDTISDMAQLNAAFWAKQLSLYVFRGERRLKDYTQIDPKLLQTFPGQYYESFGGKSMQIGVVFNDAGGVKYAGYRQLMIGYFSGSVPPVGLLGYVNLVASSDIHPKNGIIHALQWSNIRTGSGSPISNTEYFGFSSIDFINDAFQTGLIN